jgi:acyl carrier protein
MASRADILEIIRDELSAERGIDPSLVVEGAAFTEDLGMDSLDLVQLRMELEDRYEVRMADEELLEIVTVGDAIDKIVELLSGTLRPTG